MWRWILILVGVSAERAAIQYTETMDVTLQIVGIFSTSEDTAVQRAVFEKNVNDSKLSTEHVTYKLDAQIAQAQRRDSFSVWQSLCKEVAEKALTPIVVFGPQDPITDGAIRDECYSLHIPHLQANWQPTSSEIDDVKNREISKAEEIPTETEETEENDEDKERSTVEEEEYERGSTEKEFKRITINYYPHADDLSLAYSKLIKYYNWQSFTVLYEDDFGLMRIQKILSFYTTNYPVAVHRLDPGGDNRRAFKQMSKYQESRILLDCDVNNVVHYIEEAESLNMANIYQHYILTSIDASSVNNRLERFVTNITWLSITNFDELNNPQNDLAPTAWRWTSDQSAAAFPSLTSFKVEPFLMTDMSNHILAAANLLDGKLKDFRPPMPCKIDEEPWLLGAEMQDSLLKTQIKGATGIVAFDATGRRVNYTLYVNEIYLKKRDTIGWWIHSDEGDIIPEKNENLKSSSQFSNKNFRVISRFEKPYFNRVANYTGDMDSPEAYEGFGAELVAAIFETLNKMNYNYTYSYAGELIYEGKSNGGYVASTKKWNGLIGDLLDKKADLAIGDLTITEERKKVIDFSVPFMSLGISILYKKDHEVEPDTFTFLHPYSFEVWIHTATAYLVVSIVLFVCSRISLADWENPQPCDKDPEELENIWNFKNCSWLTMGSIMTQGCDILPKAIGTRWVCAMWWFFALIVCQTYIAQLAASLTSAAGNEPIKDVEDLSKQTKILYGVMNGGSTHAFFKNSKDKMYQRMFDQMETNPGVYTRDNDEGEQLVLRTDGKYAFFMESSTIEYKLKRNCELTQIGSPLDSKDYGIAMPGNSPFRTIINLAILSLKENTQLENIRKIWWEEKYDAVECEEGSVAKDNVEGDLEMKHLIGAFYVLVVGLVLCLFITAAEFLNEIRNIVVNEQVTHKEALFSELKSAFNFSQLQKPVMKNPSEAPSDVTHSKERSNTRTASVAAFRENEKTSE